VRSFVPCSETGDSPAPCALIVLLRLSIGTLVRLSIGTLGNASRYTPREAWIDGATPASLK